jgi:hypothetical protein
MTMEPRRDRTARPGRARTPAKRFRIEKLEERIAPKKGRFKNNTDPWPDNGGGPSAFL